MISTRRLRSREDLYDLAPYQILDSGLLSYKRLSDLQREGFSSSIGSAIRDFRCLAVRELENREVWIGQHGERVMELLYFDGEECKASMVFFNSQVGVRELSGLPNWRSCALTRIGANGAEYIQGSALAELISASRSLPETDQRVALCSPGALALVTIYQRRNSVLRDKASASFEDFLLWLVYPKPESATA